MKIKMFITATFVISIFVIICQANTETIETMAIRDVKALLLDDPALVIIAPCSVIEETEFVVTVTADGEPVEAVLVTFNDTLYYTDVNGVVTLTAPAVNQSMFLPINASKNGYHSAEVSVRILDDGIPPLMKITVQSGLHFRSITVTIKNVGGETAENILWTITFTNGFIIKGRNTSGTIPSLLMDQETSIFSPFVFGVGLHVLVTITVYPTNGQLWSLSIDGSLIGPFLFIRN